MKGEQPGCPTVQAFSLPAAGVLRLCSVYGNVLSPLILGADAIDFCTGPCLLSRGSASLGSVECHGCGLQNTLCQRGVPGLQGGAGADDSQCTLAAWLGGLQDVGTLRGQQGPWLGQARTSCTGGSPGRSRRTGLGCRAEQHGGERGQARVWFV